MEPGVSCGTGSGVSEGIHGAWVSGGMHGTVRGEAWCQGEGREVFLERRRFRTTSLVTSSSLNDIACDFVSLDMYNLTFSLSLLYCMLYCCPVVLPRYYGKLSLFHSASSSTGGGGHSLQPGNTSGGGGGVFFPDGAGGEGCSTSGCGTSGGGAPLTCLEVLGELFRIEGAELMQDMAVQVGGA